MVWRCWYNGHDSCPEQPRAQPKRTSVPFCPDCAASHDEVMAEHSWIEASSAELPGRLPGQMDTPGMSDAGEAPDEDEPYWVDRWHRPLDSPGGVDRPRSGRGRPSSHRPR